jgi:hypothetical protein
MSAFADGSRHSEMEVRETRFRIGASWIEGLRPTR